MADVYVCDISEIPDRERKVIAVEGTEIGVFRLGTEVFAYENTCPHMAGPVCQGKILPLVIEAVAGDKTSSGRVFSKTDFNIICPWHGFEFDIRTGQHPTDKRSRLRRVPARVMDGIVYVSVTR